jgi:hypothetical protein
MIKRREQKESLKKMREHLMFLRITPPFTARGIHVSLPLLAKKEEREAIAVQHEAIARNEDILRSKLENANEKITELVDDLISKNAIHPSFKDITDKVYEKSANKIEDADETLKVITDNPTTSNIQAEKAAYERETTTNQCLDEANAEILLNLQKLRSTLSIEDKVAYDTVVTEHMQASFEMQSHKVKKFDNIMAKFDFFEKHHED